MAGGSAMHGRTPHSPLHQSTPAELKALLEAERCSTPFLRYANGAGRRHIVFLGDGEGRLTVGRDRQADGGRPPRPHEYEVIGEGTAVVIAGGGPGVGHSHFHPWFGSVTLRTSPR
jgi:hypothetical protein